MTRVVVVDDHPMWRDAVSRDLTDAGLDVVGTAGDGRAAVDVAKHAGDGASAWVLVEDDGTYVTVSVRDDGTGFAPGTLAAAEQAGRLGVAQSLVGRMRSLGGDATVSSVSGSGTEVELRIPRRK